MSASSLLAPSIWRYDVFPSFSRKDIRRNFLGHFLVEFELKGINTFVDDQIRRSKSISPELVRAIRASRIGLVILTKNYASSSWCLDKLLDIMECRKTAGLMVMTIFYDTDPSDVREQTGDFGEAFERTCEGKTEEQKQSWREALTDIADMPGEHSRNWESEAGMMLKIAKDITNMMNFTPPSDFGKSVGMEAHIAKMDSNIECPMEHISFRIRPECLVEISMKESKLKKLWEGVSMLRSLKKLDLSWSTSLEEVPDLSEAINLEHLNLHSCHSLLKLHPSIWKLTMLEFLHLEACRNLEPLPANYALDSLSYLNISNCPKLKDFPEISSDIEYLNVSFTAIPELPPSIDFWDCLHTLDMVGCKNVTEFPPVPYTVSRLHLNATGIQEVPPWISDLYGLTELTMLCCKKLRKISPRICELPQLQLLDFTGCINVKMFPAEIFRSFSSLSHALMLSLNYIDKNSLPTFTPEETHDFPLQLSLFGNDFETIPHYVVRQVCSLYLTDCMYLLWLPELPGSLLELQADNCVSLESLSPRFRSSHDPKLIVKFVNCWKLDQQARKLVIEKWACGYAVLPGSEVPNYFTHRRLARGSSLTIYLNRRKLYGSLRFKACVVLPKSNDDELDVVSFRYFQISCYVRGRHSTTVYKWPEIFLHCRLSMNHLFILNSYFTLEEDNIPERKMRFHFKCLERKEYLGTVSSKILRCGVKFLKLCSCEYDSKAHPELWTLPLKDDEGNRNNIGETSKSKKREWSSVAEGPDKRTSKNLRIGS